MAEIRRMIIDKLNQIYGAALDKHEREIVESVLGSNQFGQVVENNKRESIKSIGFIIFSIKKYAGGTTSILRLATGLSDLGFEITFINYGTQSINELNENAKFNLANYKGVIKDFKDCASDEFDVVIATSWLSAYKLNDYEAYKMYFVQDYEPYFFKVNERYLLARQTYELGFHIVSLGPWNVNQIKRECPRTVSRLDYIDFPYEKTEYESETERDYQELLHKRQFSLAVYIKEEGKRIPNIIQNILRNAHEELAAKGIELDILFFGLNPHYKTIVGRNLGKLNKQELKQLYYRSDFGLVASMTNISLVPYEMLATGLPIFEMNNGSFPAYFGADCAMLIDFDYHTFVNKFLESITNPDVIREMVHSAKMRMDKLSWGNSCKQFAEYMIEAGQINGK